MDPLSQIFDLVFIPDKPLGTIPEAEYQKAKNEAFARAYGQEPIDNDSPNRRHTLPELVQATIPETAQEIQIGKYYQNAHAENRKYSYPNSDVFVQGVIAFAVMPSGNHRLLTENGNLVVVNKGWLMLEIHGPTLV